jgi:hypothetical protein
MNPIPPFEKTSLRKQIIRKCAVGMSSATLLIAVTLLIAGIHSKASPGNFSAKSVKTEKLSEKNSSTLTIYDELNLGKAGLELNVFEMAMKGFDKLSSNRQTGEDSVLAIVDFTKPSGTKRLFVIDLKSRKLVYHTYVSHGKNSGLQYATRFSNLPESHMSSLGFYLTKKTYNGSNGYSLQLDGCEKGVNDKAFSRAIVMHAADYANEQIAKGRGYIGRSYGCPAVPTALHKPIIDKLKDGNVLFIYYPDRKYLQQSQLING